jgi:DNA (cytosine-5)-methyltransferase 1|tara:strand:- start:3063 stop:3908 length:846 start_codon:yes stop_codon:yes gene_type:complete
MRRIKDDSKKNFTVLDLFSGIGGFSLGLEATEAFSTVAFCEQDKFCQAVLRKNWPNTPIFDDIRTLPTDRFRGVDICVGGFPCQPWSTAGKKRGAEDDRDLWPEMLRVIEAVQPEFVIGENVRGFVNEPLGLRRSLSDLEGIGYQAVPFIIPSCSVNAPHRRDRCWIIGHKNVADTTSKRMERYRTSGEQELETHERKGLPVGKGKKPRTTEWTTQQCLGLPSNGLSRWVAGDWERGIPRVTEGEEGRAMKIKALGNSVVPQVVEQIGRAIIRSKEHDQRH